MLVYTPFFCTHIYIFIRYNYRLWIYIYITCALPETSIAPENEPSQKNPILFQSSMFNCYLTFREGNVQLICCASLVSRSPQGIDRVTRLLPEALAYAQQGDFVNLKIKSDRATLFVLTWSLNKKKHTLEMYVQVQDINFVWVLICFDMTSDLEQGEEPLANFSAEFMPGRMLSIKILSEDCIRTLWLSGAGFDHAICNWNRPNCHS